MWTSLRLASCCGGGLEFTRAGDVSRAFGGGEAEEGFEEEGGGHEEEEGAPDFGGEGAAVVDGVFDVAGVEAGEEFFDGGAGEGGAVL